MTQRQARDKETKENTVFLRKKKLHKRENGFTMNTQKHHLMDHAVNQSTHQFHKIFFHISKCLKKHFEDDKKRMNIDNFINIYT